MSRCESSILLADLHIRGDKNVRCERVTQTMAAAQRAGVKEIGFSTEPNITVHQPAPLVAHTSQHACCGSRKKRWAERLQKRIAFEGQ